MITKKIVRIGILHSLTGTMSISEKPLVDAAQMAINEINQSGGVLGKQLKAEIVDGASDPTVFARQATALNEKNINTLFGCWTSASRKAVKKVVEGSGGQLWYPIQYEGLEQSPNIFYIGSTLNQQIEPAVNWCMKSLGRKFYLIASDYVFPRAANRLIRSLVHQKGGNIADEHYLSLGATNFDEVLANIRKHKPDVVFNTLNGDSNIAFYKQMADHGMLAKDWPVMAVSVSESEIASIVKEMHGHFFCWGYFQTVDTPENHVFVKAFKQYNGKKRVTSDPIATAYSQIHLWANTVNKTGSINPEDVRKNVFEQSLASPLGRLIVNRNHHVSRWARVGQASKSGQIKILWQSEQQIEPLPWLGLEKTNLSTIDLIREALAGFTQSIDFSYRLEKEIDERQLIEEKLQYSNNELEAKNNELKKVLAELKKISGLLPICAKCKKIRDDSGYWNQIEIYIEKHSEARFSHGLCQECSDDLYGDQDWYKKTKKKI